MRRSLLPAAALVAAMAGSMTLAPAAFASDGAKTLPLHQIEDLPLTASEWDGSKEKVCGNIPTSQDGWHFVLPGKSAVFTKLTVEFEPGGVQTITVFGPPDAKHAYVGSAPDAKLISAKAEIDGEVKQGFFNLSHTCPASETGGTTGETTTGETTTGETTTGETTTGETTTGETTATGETTTGETTSTGETTATSGSATGETATTSGSTTGGATTGETTGGSAAGGSEEGNLAETGSSAPVGIIAAAALALAAAGAVLVTRRRKAQQ
ncbi:LPXTG cell wall anchor domain-containing protein [Streptomyces sp. SS]|uniref:LPXTG cell wall anchor domain-containing protein n=1 Tax=Streptomyces sp. SS TaxID=260742 RepID=UPI0003026038|nr:LPXTG cell wall anchor domain-containing protein [Streptomyces sp. SS]